MDSKTLAVLKKISTPKNFKKDEYICYEGQLGSEMYIVLKGSIGVNITTALGTLIEVAQIETGNFFGEMAIFDNLPRSASCIALEDTVCVAINKGNLNVFLANCPELAVKMLENMSSRIRKLNNDLYKVNNSIKKKEVPKFDLPKEYGFHHIVKEPFQDDLYYEEFECKCPICKNDIILNGIRKNVMQVHKIEGDGRIKYLRCEPLWYEVQTCPHCYYSNHHINFFKIEKEDCDKVKRILKEEHMPVIIEDKVNRTPFDNLVMSYLQAIHINEHINQSDNAFIGMLWLKLYWLSVDSGDDKFTSYCATNVIDKLRKAIDMNEINDITNKCSLALSLSYILKIMDMKSDALKYSIIALGCPDDRIKELACKLKNGLTK